MNFRAIIGQNFIRKCSLENSFFRIGIQFTYSVKGELFGSCVIFSHCNSLCIFSHKTFQKCFFLFSFLYEQSCNFALDSCGNCFSYARAYMQPIYKLFARETVSDFYLCIFFIPTRIVARCFGENAEFVCVIQGNGETRCI